MNGPNSIGDRARDPFAHEGVSEQRGYALFLKFWKEGNRPDAIIVSDDILCFGVLRAILHLGINVPDQLRVIVRANKGVAFPYHLPMTWVDFDPADQASKAIEMMEALLTDRDAVCQHVTLAGKLLRGATA